MAHSFSETCGQCSERRDEDHTGWQDALQISRFPAFWKRVWFVFKLCNSVLEHYNLHFAPELEQVVVALGALVTLGETHWLFVYDKEVRTRNMYVTRLQNCVHVIWLSFASWLATSQAVSLTCNCFRNSVKESLLRFLQELCSCVFPPNTSNSSNSGETRKQPRF